MPERPRRRRRGLKILSVLVILIAVLWVGYWFASDRLVAMAVERATAAFAERGRTVDCERPATGGFPLSLDLTCGKARYADAGASVSAEVAGFSATAPLWWPGSVRTALASPLTVSVAGDSALSLDASWTTGFTTVDAGIGGLHGASADFTGLVVTREGGGRRVPFARLAADSAMVATAPAGGDDYGLSASARNLVVKPNGVRELPPLDLDVAATALGFGGALGTDPQRAIRAWLASGGRLSIERFAVASGGASGTVSGALSVSADGLISGNLNIRLAGLDRLPDLVGAVAPKQKDNAASAVAMISAFGKPVPGDPNARDAPLVIDRGRMSIGVIPLGSIPPLRF